MTETGASVPHANSPTNSDDFKPSNIIDRDGTVLNPADPMAASSLANGDGFKPVDPIIEPWFIPDWANLDATILFYENSDELYKEKWLEFYKELKEWVIECPSILDIANSMEQLWWGDASQVRDISKTLPARILSYLITHHADYALYNAHEFVGALSLLAALLNNHIVRLGIT